MITTPEYAALRDADSLDRELLHMGIQERYVVLNKVIAEMMNAGYAPRLREITSSCARLWQGIIQYDENIQISTNLGVPIVLSRAPTSRRTSSASREGSQNRYNGASWRRDSRIRLHRNRAHGD